MVQPSQENRNHPPISVLKGLYKLKGQTAGKIWVVFARWTRVFDGLIDKVLSHSMRHSVCAFMLSLRYFVYFLLIFSFVFIYLFNCAVWECIVAFTKALTIYQLYHT
jgi:hypothetical protein